MSGAYIYAWDANAQKWVKVAVNSSGEIEIVTS